MFEARLLVLYHLEYTIVREVGMHISYGKWWKLVGDTAFSMRTVGWLIKGCEQVDNNVVRSGMKKFDTEWRYYN
jgi:hypothetical protein